MADATLAFDVKAAGIPTEGAAVLLSFGGEYTTNQDGYVALQAELGWFSYSVHKAGYKDYFSPPINLTGNHTEYVTLQPNHVRLAMKDPFYLNVTLTGTIGFSDYYRWLNPDRVEAYSGGRTNHELLEAIYRQCEELPGHNARSVFFSCDHICHLHPEEHANFYAELDRFAEFSLAHGQYVFPIFIADGEASFSSEAAARHHVAQMITFVERWGFASKMANEGHAHTNFPWNMASFPRPDTPFGYYCHEASHFSPSDPQGDFQCFHPTRKGNGAIKDCNVYDHPARMKDSDYTYPPTWKDKGVGIGEPDGFGLDPRPDGKNYSTDPKRAREMGVGTSTGTACYSFMLTPHGKLSIPFDDEVLPLVRAWFGVTGS